MLGISRAPHHVATISNAVCRPWSTHVSDGHCIVRTTPCRATPLSSLALCQAAEAIPGPFGSLCKQSRQNHGAYTAAMMCRFSAHSCAAPPFVTAAPNRCRIDADASGYGALPYGSAEKLKAQLTAEVRELEPAFFSGDREACAAADLIRTPVRI
mgnify:CR=1 FL=1